jgi:hypothetical protein
MQNGERHSWQTVWPMSGGNTLTMSDAITSLLDMASCLGRGMMYTAMHLRMLLDSSYGSERVLHADMV